MGAWLKVKGMSAWIGIDDAVKTMGSTEFIVDVFANGKWERAFKSEVLTVDNAAIKVEVEFPAGTEFVRLIATDGGNGGSADHAVWADARFTE